MVAIAVFALAVNANGQQCNPGDSHECTIVGFPIGIDINGSGDTMCADFQITFTCNAIPCDVSIIGTVTFYECGSGAGAITYQFSGSGIYSSTGGYTWSFNIDLGSGWVPITTTSPFVILTGAGSTGTITCNLGSILMGNGIPGAPNLPNQTHFHGCLTSPLPGGFGCP